jgi:hypothetical protein
LIKLPIKSKTGPTVYTTHIGHVILVNK